MEHCLKNIFFQIIAGTYVWRSLTKQFPAEICTYRTLNHIYIYNQKSLKNKAWNESFMNQLWQQHNSNLHLFPDGYQHWGETSYFKKFKQVFPLTFCPGKWTFLSSGTALTLTHTPRLRRLQAACRLYSLFLCTTIHVSVTRFSEALIH